MTDAGKVPDGNPFDNLTWSYGHRNVEGIRFDDTGRLWIAEFGDKGADELNLIRPGKNYGWPDVEGSDGKGGYADPLAEWPVDQCSPSGIAIAAGRAWLGALQGECVWSVVLDGAGRREDPAALRGRVRPDPLGRPRPRRLAVGDHLQPGRPHRPARRRRPDPAGHPVTGVTHGVDTVGACSVLSGESRLVVRGSSSLPGSSSWCWSSRWHRRSRPPRTRPSSCPATTSRSGLRAAGGRVPAGQPVGAIVVFDRNDGGEAHRGRPGPGRRGRARAGRQPRRGLRRDHGAARRRRTAWSSSPSSGCPRTSTGFDTPSFDAVKKLRSRPRRLGQR